MSTTLELVLTGTKDVISLKEEPSELIYQEVITLNNHWMGSLGRKLPICQVVVSGVAWGKPTDGLETKGNKILK